ncbi:MAG: branched-chain amino acid ABC transporter ATP-binding protein/permease [Candidatus Dormibacteraceae bacterium]
MKAEVAQVQPSDAPKPPAWILPPRAGLGRWLLRRGLLLLGVTAVLTAPTWLGPGDQYIAGLAVIAVLLALSYNLLLGTTGMVSFGHAAFYGIGAFTVALVATRLHRAALIGLVLSPVIGMLAGLIVGAFCLRAVRLYFSLLTLAVSQLLYVAAFESYDITGGDNGIHGIPVPDFLNDPVASYYFVVAVVLAGGVILWLLTRSPFGAALNAIRENRQRAAFLGLWVKAYELAAFATSACLASVAGSLYALYDQQAYPALMFWTESGTPVVMVLIGGMRAFLGPAFGAVFYTFAAAKVQNATTYWDLIIGAILLLIVLLLPGGFAGVPAQVSSLLAGRRGLAVAAGRGDGDTSSGLAAPEELPTMAPVVRQSPNAGPSTIVLEVQGLVKRFGGLSAVDGVNLSVQAGSVHAVIGPNGAGKSTLFGLISGQLRPDAGKVQFEGRDVTGLPPQVLAHAGMGRAFQSTSIFPGMTAMENVRLAIMGIRGDTRKPYGFASRLHRERVTEVLASVGLSDYAGTRASELSHGDQRALELAISLALGARLLLLDEPTAGMSPYETRRTLQLLRHLTAERGITLLFTEHDMEVVFGIAERVTVMAEGRVLTEGSPEEVREHPEVVRVYLGGGQ